MYKLEYLAALLCGIFSCLETMISTDLLRETGLWTGTELEEKLPNVGVTLCSLVMRPLFLGRCKEQTFSGGSIIITLGGLGCKIANGAEADDGDAG